MATQMKRHLRHLVAGLASPAPSDAAAHALEREAQGFDQATLECSSAELSDAAELKSLMFELSAALEALNTALLQSRLSLSATGLNNIAAWLQLSAACVATVACCHLGNALAVQRNDAFRIARGGMLLVCGAGQAALAECVDKARLQPGEQTLGPLVEMVQQQLQAVYFMPMLLLPQLPAIRPLTDGWIAGRTKQEIAAFLASMAPPQAVPPWLATMAEALHLSFYHPGGSPSPLIRSPSIVHQYVFVVNVLLVLAPRQHHHAAAASVPVSRLLLAHLGTLAAQLEELSAAGRLNGAGTGAAAAGPARLVDGQPMLIEVPAEQLALATVADIVNALASDQMRPAMQAVAGEPAVGLLAAEHSARIFLALPVPAAVEGPRLAPACECAARMLGGICVTLKAALPDADGTVSNDWNSAALAVMRAVPHLAATLHAMALPADGEIAARLCSYFLPPLELFFTMLYMDSVCMDSGEQVVAWAAAADASLRLLPRLAQLDAWCQQERRERQQRGEVDGEWEAGCWSRTKGRSYPAILAANVAVVLWSSNTKNALEWADSAGFSTTASPSQPEQLPPCSLVEAVWGLHSRSCRLIHWLLQAPDRPALVQFRWRSIIVGHAQALTLAAMVLLGAERHGVGGSTSSPSSSLRALCAAHFEALHALLGAPDAAALLMSRPPAELPADAASHALVGSGLAAVLSGIASLPLCCWPLMDEAMLEQLVKALQPCFAAEVAGSVIAAYKAKVLASFCGGAIGQPHVAIALVRAGMLQLLLSRELMLGAAIVAAQALATFRSLVDSLKSAAESIRQALLEGSQVGDAASSSSQGGSSIHAAPAADLAQQLAAALEALPPVPEAGSGEALSEASALLQPLAALADLAHQGWQQSGQAAAARLELAQAASARSCAYLACSNLCGEGGPAAGQGVGSRRCGQCRAVWYCGTACSHADWRAGGHRRVCKALAAARQAAKKALA